MASTATLQRLKTKADQADEIIGQLQAQLTLLKQAKASLGCVVAEKKLEEENERLRQEVEKLRTELVLTEIHNGVKQVFLPVNRNVVNTNAEKLIATPSEKAATPKPEKPPVKMVDPPQKQDKAKEKSTVKKEAKAKKENKAGSGAEEKIDCSRLDLRVGLVVSAEKHPDADSLYVENVDLGEGKNRTVVSGLAGKIPLEQMQNKIAVFMVNLKPAKMRGIMSEAMIMCATGDTVTEILVPPSDAVIGDRVTCSDYEGTPDAQLPPKKKIWEQLKPDMRTNDQKVATFKGSVFTVAGKGPLLAPTLSNAQIS